MKICSPWEGFILEKLMVDCLPWEGLHAGAKCEEKEGVAQTTCDELTTTPIPCSPVPLQGGGRENQE